MLRQTTLFISFYSVESSSPNCCADRSQLNCSAWARARDPQSSRNAGEAISSIKTSASASGRPGGTLMPPAPMISGIAEVSVPAVDAPPWVAPVATVASEAAWRDDCDGGVLVGGHEGTGYGFLATFQLDGGVACNWP